MLIAKGLASAGLCGRELTNWYAKSHLANICVAIRELEMLASQKVGHAGIGTKAGGRVGATSFPQLQEIRTDEKFSPVCRSSHSPAFGRARMGGPTRRYKGRCSALPHTDRALGNQSRSS